MRLIATTLISGLLISTAVLSQNLVTQPGSLIDASTPDEGLYLPPPPADSQPLTQNYLNQLNAPASRPPAEHRQLAAPQRPSRLPPAPYLQGNMERQAPVSPSPYGGGGNQWQINRSPMDAGGWRSNTPRPPARQTPTASRQLPVDANLNWPPAPTTEEVDPGEHLPPELAKQRTLLRRQSRQDNHQLVGELMAAQDAVEDVMAMERPNPDEVGQAYARVFDVQRRMIELRVRTQNALLDIWDQARKDIKDKAAIPEMPRELGPERP